MVLRGVWPRLDSRHRPQCLSYHTGEILPHVRIWHQFPDTRWVLQWKRLCRRLTVCTALFFAELQFSDFRIGLFMTLTLLGDVFLGVFLTLIADRVGRRKILFGGSVSKLIGRMSG